MTEPPSDIGNLFVRTQRGRVSFSRRPVAKSNPFGKFMRFYFSIYNFQSI
jgi:hypothetical protein